MAVFGTLVSMGGSSKVSHITCLIPNPSFSGLQSSMYYWQCFCTNTGVHKGLGMRDWEWGIGNEGLGMRDWEWGIGNEGLGMGDLE